MSGARLSSEAMLSLLQPPRAAQWGWRLGSYQCEKARLRHAQAASLSSLGRRAGLRPCVPAVVADGSSRTAARCALRVVPLVSRVQAGPGSTRSRACTPHARACTQNIYNICNQSICCCVCNM